MAVACSTTPTSGSYLTPLTVAYTGLTADTAYIVTETSPSGEVNYREITSDGSGEASYDLVPKSQGGTLTFDIRPATEHDGTTTAALSTTVNVSPGSG